jgi:hypothetical protein
MYVAQRRPDTNQQFRRLPAPGRFGRVPTSTAIAIEEEAVAISQQLLEILVCPVCKTPVALTPDNGGLKCQTCRRVYPIRDDIPVMLPEEATVAPE